MSDVHKISDIMTSNLITMSLKTPVYEVVKSMQEKMISSIVIVENNKPVGIITERDILKASLSPEKNLKKIASELMSSPVFTIEKNTDYRDAYMQMSEHKIRHLIVVDKTGDLLGLLSESDFLNQLNPEQLLAIKEVSKVMTSNVLTCSPENSVHSVLQQMAECRIGGIVVEEKNKAIGVVSERDALKLIQQDNATLQEPIKTYMSSPVLTIHKSQTVLNAQTIMENSHIRRLVVVDDDEKIAGIVTRHDLIKSIPEYYVEILREMIERQKSLVSKTQIDLDEKTIFHNAMKSLPHNLVFMTNQDGIIQFINTKETGVCNIPNVNAGSDLTSLEGNLFEVIKNNEWKERVVKGETLHKIVKVPNKLSEFCYFHTSVSAIFNTEGEFEGYMYIARDISQEQTLEKELKRLNENLQVAYQVANIGNFELDAKTLNAFWSNEVCDIFGMEHDTQGGMHVLKTLVKPEDFIVIEKSLLSAIHTGSAHEITYEVFPLNGSEPTWVECRARCELDDDGNTKSLIGTVQNITQRVKTQKHIQHLNSLLKAIRNINQLIVKEKDIDALMQAICNEVTGVKKFNGVWIILKDEKSTLYSTGFDDKSIAILKQNISQNTFPPCCDVKDKLKTYEEPPIVCSLCDLAQSYFNSDALVVPIVYENNFYGHLGLSIGKDLIQNDEEQELVQEMADDIAFSIFTTKEREKHEKEQKRYKSLVQHSNDAIYMHTMEGVLLDVNPALEKIHGCSRDELIGANVMDFYQPHQLEIAQTHFETIQETGTVSFEMELLKIDGTPFQAELVASLVEFDGETVIQGSFT